LLWSTRLVRVCGGVLPPGQVPMPTRSRKAR
jgi:hypothetical protein